MKIRRFKTYGQLKAEERAAKKELEEAKAEAARLKREAADTSIWTAANGAVSHPSLIMGVPQSINKWISFHRANKRVAAAQRHLQRTQSNIQAKRTARKKGAAISFGIGVAGAGLGALLRHGQNGRKQD